MSTRRAGEEDKLDKETLNHVNNDLYFIIEETHVPEEQDLGNHYGYDYAGGGDGPDRVMIIKALKMIAMFGSTRKKIFSIVCNLCSLQFRYMYRQTLH